MRSSVTLQLRAIPLDTSLPAFVPAPGKFKRIEEWKNVLMDVKPPIYQYGSTTDPTIAMASWSTAVKMRDGGRLGSICYVGEDHTATQYYLSTNVADLDALEWRINNNSTLGHGPMFDGVNGKMLPNTQWPMPPELEPYFNPGHTYWGLFERTVAEGAEGAKGDLMAFGPSTGGQTKYNDMIIQRDWTKELYGQKMFVESVNEEIGLPEGVAQRYSYSMACKDFNRRGIVYLGRYQYGSKMLRYDFINRTGFLTNVTTGWLQEPTLQWPEKDVLVHLHDWSPTKGGSNGIYQCVGVTRLGDTVNDIKRYEVPLMIEEETRAMLRLEHGTWFRESETVERFGLARIGLCRSKVAQAFYCRNRTHRPSDNKSSPVLYKLFCDGPDPLVGPWRLTHEVLESQDGSELDVAGSAEIMGLLQEVPEWLSLFWGESNTGKPQLIRPRDM